MDNLMYNNWPHGMINSCTQILLGITYLWMVLEITIVDSASHFKTIWITLDSWFQGTALLSVQLHV